MEFVKKMAHANVKNNLQEMIVQLKIKFSFFS